MNITDIVIVTLAIAFVVYVIFNEYRNYQQAKKEGKGTPCPSCQVDSCGVADNCVTKEK